MLDMIIAIVFNNNFNKLNTILDDASASEIKKKIIESEDKFERESFINELLNLSNEIVYKEGFKNGLKLYNELKEV